jgi:hypothetical protein
MEKTIELRFEIKSWDEQPTRELPEDAKVTRAQVVLAGDPDGLAEGYFESVMYYRPDGTSSFASLTHLQGTLGGRSGGFVLQGQGTYDGSEARGESYIVPGSGTGELAGLTGSAVSVSTHEDYPFMPLTLTYEMG